MPRVRGGGLSGTVIRDRDAAGPEHSVTVKLFRGVARNRLPIAGPGMVPPPRILVREVADALIRTASLPESRVRACLFAGGRSAAIQECEDLIAGVAGVEPWKQRIPVSPVQLVGEAMKRGCWPPGATSWNGSAGLSGASRRSSWGASTCSPGARRLDGSGTARELGCLPPYKVEKEINPKRDSHLP